MPNPLASTLRPQFPLTKAAMPAAILGASIFNSLKDDQQTAFSVLVSKITIFKFGIANSDYHYKMVGWALCAEAYEEAKGKKPKPISYAKKYLENLEKLEPRIQAIIPHLFSGYKDKTGKTPFIGNLVALRTYVHQPINGDKRTSYARLTEVEKIFEDVENTIAELKFVSERYPGSAAEEATDWNEIRAKTWARGPLSARKSIQMAAEIYYVSRDDQDMVLRLRNEYRNPKQAAEPARAPQPTPTVTAPEISPLDILTTAKEKDAQEIEQLQAQIKEAYFRIEAQRATIERLNGEHVQTQTDLRAIASASLSLVNGYDDLMTAINDIDLPNELKSDRPVETEADRRTIKTRTDSARPASRLKMEPLDMPERPNIAGETVTFDDIEPYLSHAEDEVRVLAENIKATREEDITLHRDELAVVSAYEPILDKHADRLRAKISSNKTEEQLLGHFWNWMNQRQATLAEKHEDLSIKLTAYKEEQAAKADEAERAKQAEAAAQQAHEKEKTALEILEIQNRIHFMFDRKTGKSTLVPPAKKGASRIKVRLFKSYSPKVS